jgi:cell division protein FtsW
VVLGLFALLVFRGTRAALRARDSYGTLLAAGLTAWIGTQALINIGAVSRAIPFTGITLPFVSYGGTSLAVTLAAMGLLLNISRYQAPRRAPTLTVVAGGGAGGAARPRWRDRLRRARPSRPSGA